MIARHSTYPAAPLHPLHSVFLAFPFPLFLGALASDVAYSATFQVQWANFASWLIAGGLLGSAFAVLWALINIFRFRADRRPLLYFILLLVMWGLGLVNAFVHAKDAWAAMPTGLYLSAVTVLLALAATWTGFAGFFKREAN